MKVVHFGIVIYLQEFQKLNNNYGPICCAEEYPKTEYCTIDMNEEKFQAFSYAIKNHYWYQMYIDDLPIWGRIRI